MFRRQRLLIPETSIGFSEPPIPMNDDTLLLMPVTGYKDCLPLYFCPVTVILDVAVDKDLCFTKLLVFSSVLV